MYLDLLILGSSAHRLQNDKKKVLFLVDFNVFQMWTPEDLHIDKAFLFHLYNGSLLLSSGTGTACYS